MSSFDSLRQCANALHQDDKQDAYPSFKLEACDYCTLDSDFILFTAASHLNPLIPDTFIRLPYIPMI